MSGQNNKTPVVLVLAAWLFVSIPWAWGVDQLWKNARKLFATPPAATMAPANTMAPTNTMAPAAPAGSPAPAAPK